MVKERPQKPTGRVLIKLVCVRYCAALHFTPTQPPRRGRDGQIRGFFAP